MKSVLECCGIWFHVHEYPGKFSPFRNKLKKDWTLSQYWKVVDLTFATVSLTHAHIQHVQGVKHLC